MSEYIKREDVYKTLNLVLYVDGCEPSVTEIDMDAFESIPAADVEPVVRGKWTPNKRHAGFMVCDQCRFGIPINTMVVMECNRRSDEREFCVCAGDVELAYCPNCGAHMERSGSGE